MSLTNRTALYVASSWFHLPPFDLESNPREVCAQYTFDIPHGGGATPYNKRHGWEIPVTGRYVFDTVEEGRTWQRELREALRDTNGAARSVDLVRWSGGAYADQNEAYRYCTATGDGVEFSDEPGQTDASRTYRFTLRSTDPGLYASARGGYVPPAGPYEDYVYNGSGGGGGGVSLSQTLVLNFFFAGLVEATGSGNVYIMQGSQQLPATVTATWRLVEAEVVSCGGVHSAATSTVFAVADASYVNDLSNGKLQTSVSAGVGSGLAASGAVDFEPGDSVWCYCRSTGGGHSNVMIKATFTTL